jgi:hypothetical protein
MDQKQDTKPQALSLEVQEIEAWCNPGCGSSTTSNKCTCPISITTTGSLFTAKTTS